MTRVGVLLGLSALVLARPGPPEPGGTHDAAKEESQVVLSVEISRVAAATATYNFEVADDHRQLLAEREPILAEGHKVASELLQELVGELKEKHPVWFEGAGE